MSDLDYREDLPDTTRSEPTVDQIIAAETLAAEEYWAKHPEHEPVRRVCARVGHDWTPFQFPKGTTITTGKPLVRCNRCGEARYATDAAFADAWVRSHAQ